MYQYLLKKLLRDDAEAIGPAALSVCIFYAFAFVFVPAFAFMFVLVFGDTVIANGEAIGACLLGHLFMAEGQFR